MEETTNNVEKPENTSSKRKYNVSRSMSAVKFIRFMRNLAIQHGLSQNQFARECDLPHFNAIVNFKNPITKNTIFKLSRKLNQHNIIEFCLLVTELKHNEEIRK